MGGSYWSCWDYVFRKFFFDWTSQYGMSPGRSLLLGLYVWGLCSLVYLGLVHSSGPSGLYLANVKLGDSNKEFHRLHLTAVGEARGFRLLLRHTWREWEALRVSMFFSAISALNIGFKGFDFGRWLKLLTRQEFDMCQGLGPGRVRLAITDHSFSYNALATHLLRTPLRLIKLVEPSARAHNRLPT